ncbi:thioredoxin TrxC [Piscinibacter sakaiensis]|uniref:thioredoxin TrxC n=1 Tax=Piscinibacter sakaiensis TaxID=1547922 RepID=UPI003AAF5746
MDNSSPHVACSHCQAVNRIPAERLGESPVCGRCGNALLDGTPIELDDANFDRVTSRTDLPVLVDFWAPWCGPCHAMAPQFDQASRQLKGRVLTAKVNVDASPQTAQRFGIRSIPTLVRLQHGREVARQAGATQAAQIVAFGQ